MPGGFLRLNDLRMLRCELTSREQKEMSLHAICVSNTLRGASSALGMARSSKVVDRCPRCPVAQVHSATVCPSCQKRPHLLEVQRQGLIAHLLCLRRAERHQLPTVDKQVDNTSGVLSAFYHRKRREDHGSA